MRRRSQRGMVTAEAALVIPLVAAFAMVLAWMVSVVIAEVQVVDASRDAARALARGDEEQTAVAAALATAPDGAAVAIAGSGGQVTVHVTAQAEAPGWLLVPLPSVALSSESTVAVEGDGP